MPVRCLGLRFLRWLNSIPAVSIVHGSPQAFACRLLVGRLAQLLCYPLLHYCYFSGIFSLLWPLLTPEECCSLLRPEECCARFVLHCDLEVGCLSWWSIWSDGQSNYSCIICNSHAMSLIQLRLSLSATPCLGSQWWSLSRQTSAVPDLCCIVTRRLVE